MSKKKKGKFKQQKNLENKKTSLGLQTETVHSIWAIIFFVLALFLFLSAFKVGGIAGEFVYKILYYLLGVGYVLLPTLMLLLGYSFISSKAPNIGLNRTVSSILFLLSSLGIVDIVATEKDGGVLGMLLARPFTSLFDVYVSILFLGAILIISMLIMFDAKPNLVEFFRKIKNFILRKKDEEEILNEEDEEEEENEEEETLTKEPKKKKGMEEGEEEKIRKAIENEKNKNLPKEEEDIPIRKLKHLSADYTPPPISLLEEDKGKPNTGDIKANALVIKRTLLNFGIEVEMDEVTIGPTITRYALKPAEGVKLSRIVGLQNDLSLALAAHPIRIEAPIPGKSLVGIEIPNKAKSTVGLATLLKDEKFKTSNKALTIALGRGIAGKAQFANLAKLPHALIAGTTGSGKSVTIHAIITSLLYRNGPQDLKLILIDPKRVELTLYNKIPHLLTPVITDAKKAILALKWAAKEMDRRYDIFEAETVRDIESYRNNVFGKKSTTKTNSKGEEVQIEAERLPYIVIIIDELADIMTAYPKELETAIVRLAQMSRAVGIHLILSTQRPEVNVITGLIKANIPARVALKVSSQIDSRTILDAGGAEKLLGAGDMLYSSGEAQPERLQSAFISENEVKSVVKFLADSYRDEVGDEINLTGSISPDKSIFESVLENEEEEIEDELYEEARAVVMEGGRASTSFLQRRLGVGYSRGAKLIDMLEKKGVIGPQNGSKPRDILEKIEHTEDGENIV